MEEAIGWLFIGWMLVVMVCAPLAWAWLMWDERKDRRRVAAEDQAIRLTKEAAVSRHPAAKRKARGPEDDPRFMDWLNNRKDR